MTKLLCCILATLIVGAFCTASAQDASDRRKRNEDRSDRRSDQRVTEEKKAAEGDATEGDAAEAVDDDPALTMSPLEAEKIRLKSLLKRLHTDETEHYAVYIKGAEFFAKQAAELQDKAEKYAEAREKRRITEKTTTEKRYDWYDQLATMLNAAGAARKQIQLAAYQNPLKPKIDTKKAEEVFELAVADFKELHKNPPKKKRQRRKG